MALCFDCEEQTGLRSWKFSDEEREWSIGLPVEAFLCYSCWSKRDNYEPPEPDGETFRGRDAEGFERETQADIMRDLKR